MIVKMNFPQEHFYKQTQHYLTVVGQWPYQNRKSQIIRRTIVILILSNSVIFQVTALFQSWNNLDIILALLPILVALTWALISAIILYSTEDKFKNIWIRMGQDWLSERTPEENKIKESYARNGQLAIKFIYGLFTIGCILFCVFGTFISEILDFIFPLNETREHILFFVEELYIDQQKYFYFIIFRNYINLWCATIFALANYGMAINHCQHCVGMFGELGYRLENPIPGKILETDKFLKARDIAFEDSIIISLQRHRKALEFAAALDDYYAPYFVGILVVSLFLICPALIQLGNSNVMGGRTVLQIPVTIAFIFIIMLMGQRIIDLSISIGEKVYFSPWYTVSSKLQKTIILIIRRCEIPCNLSACHIYIASLDCFRMIMQAGFTYYAAIKQMQ